MIAAVEDTLRVVDANEALPTSVFEGPILRCGAVSAGAWSWLLWLLLWPSDLPVVWLPGLRRIALLVIAPVCNCNKRSSLPARLPPDFGAPCRLAASPCGKFVAGYAQDATIHVWTAGGQHMLAPPAAQCADRSEPVPAC